MEARELKDKASALFTKGRFAKAAETYEEFCALDKKDHQARLRCGDAWSKAGKKDKAIGAYSLAAEGYAKDGFLPRAIAASKLVLEIDPAHKGVQKMLAELYAQKSGGARGGGVRGPSPSAVAAAPAHAAPAQAAPAQGQELEISRGASAPVVSNFANRKDAIDLDAPVVTDKPRPGFVRLKAEVPSPMNRADALELPEYEIPMGDGPSSVGGMSAQRGPNPQRRGDAIEIEVDEGSGGGPKALVETTIDIDLGGGQPVTGEIEIPIEGQALPDADQLPAELQVAQQLAPPPAPSAPTFELSVEVPVPQPPPPPAAEVYDLTVEVPPVAPPGPAASGVYDLTEAIPDPKPSVPVFELTDVADPPAPAPPPEAVASPPVQAPVPPPVEAVRQPVAPPAPPAESLPVPEVVAAPSPRAPVPEAPVAPVRPAAPRATALPPSVGDAASAPPSIKPIQAGEAAQPPGLKPRRVDAPAATAPAATAPAATAPAATAPAATAPAATAPASSSSRIWLPPAFTPASARAERTEGSQTSAAAPAPEPVEPSTDLERSLQTFMEFDPDAPAPRAAPPAPSFTELDLEGDSLLHAVEAAAAIAVTATTPIEEPMEAPEDGRAEPGALPKIPLFSDLPEDAFIALFEKCPLQRFDEGQLVFEQGEKADAFYVICGGQVRVFRTDGGARKDLATLEEGSFFGEMALLSEAPRSASVEAAAEDTQVLVISAEILKELSTSYPVVSTALKKFCRQRMLSNLMNQAPIFAPFNRNDRRDLVQKFRARDVNRGDVLVKEGSASDGLYVVLSGEVEVESKGQRITTLKEGQVFGEMSLLMRSPASATVRAMRHTSLLRLPKHDFDMLILSHPQVLEHVSTLIDERKKADLGRQHNDAAEIL